MKHKWRLADKAWVCGWCKQTLPNTPAGRHLALHERATGCSRMTPEQVSAADARADEVNEEIALWRAGGMESTLSDDAIREVNRRHYRRSPRAGLLAAMMVATAAPRRL